LIEILVKYNYNMEKHRLIAGKKQGTGFKQLFLRSSFIQKLSIRTVSRVDFRDITAMVEQAVSSSGIRNGACYIFIPHTTAAVTINESADPDVVTDIATHLDTLVPQSRGFRHSEGNSPAHIKASLLGNSEVLLFENGKLVLGTWQGIFLCEFDGPRTRSVLIKIMPEAFAGPESSNKA